MNTSDTNYCMLQSWQLAYSMVGEAALPPFGLSEADIDAVLTIDELTRRRWAMSPISLVQPRRGLLTALRARNDARIYGFIADGRGPLTTPAITRLPHAANAQLLSAWRGATSNPDLSSLFDLDQADVTALKAADEAAIEQWSTLPVAVATPRPGLLTAMFEIAQPKFVAFLQSIKR